MATGPLCIRAATQSAAVGCLLLAGVSGQAQTPGFVSRGLRLSWEAGDVADGSASVPDGSGAGNAGRLAGAVAIQRHPSRFEFDGTGAVVGTVPLRPDHVTIEAVFRIDRTRGPLQLVVTTHPPQVRKTAAAASGNPRQWFLQIRGNPPQEDGFPGFLEFGIFGEDGRWHAVMSETLATRGWHHAVGTYDGTQVRFFLDNREQTRTRTGQPARYRGRLNHPSDAVVNLPAVGTNSPHHPNGLAGAVALVRWYDRALDHAAVARNHAYAVSRVPDLSRQTARRRPVKAPYTILYSNDFTNLNIVSPWHAKGEPFDPQHLRASVRETQGVDVHMLQPAHGAVPWWPSGLYTIREHHAWWAANYGIDASDLPVPGVHRYILAGGDPFADFVAACNRAEQAPFISLRLNDTHHLQHADTPGNRHGIHAISRVYVEHPEWRLGAAGSGLNWSIPEVRNHMFAFIREICEGYELAGFELDFMRFPKFFKDDVPTEQRLDIMTRFVTDVRALLDRTARPEQHRWLCVRVPCLLDMHPDIGLDLPSLVDAGVDMVNLSASYFTFQDHDLAAIRRLVPDVALYLEMCHCTMTGQRLTTTGGDNFLFMRTTDEQFTTTAHMAYRRGADGVSLFNFVYYREHGVPGRGPFTEPPFHLLPHLDDRDWLARQPQWYVLADNWFTKSAGQLPARVEKGDAKTFELDMAPTEHQVNEGMLRLMIDGDCRTCQWMVKVNGTTLAPVDVVLKPLDHPYESGLGEPHNYACFSCPRGLVHEGINKLALILENGGPVTVRYLDLVLP